MINGGLNYLTLGQGGFNNSQLPQAQNPGQSGTPDLFNYQSLYGSYFDTPQEIFGQNAKTNPLSQFSSFDQLPDWAMNYYQQNRPSYAFEGSNNGQLYNQSSLNSVNALNGQDPFYMQNHIDPSTFQNGYINFTNQNPFKQGGTNSGQLQTGLADPIMGRFLPGAKQGHFYDYNWQSPSNGYQWNG